ncbi:hypothetical protein A2U01_0063520, partial [Trifolium medium]|nr:hypothetical protein [Trifolium medium]
KASEYRRNKTDRSQAPGEKQQARRSTKLRLPKRPLKNMHARCSSLQGSLSDHALL